MRRPSYRPLNPEMYEDPSSCADAKCFMNSHSCPEGMNHCWRAHSDIRMRRTPKFMIVVLSLNSSGIRSKGRNAELNIRAVIQQSRDLVAR